jgi:transposase
MRTSILGKLHFVASNYDPETRARAVRLVLENRGDYPIEWAAITAVQAVGDDRRDVAELDPSASG